MQKLADGVGMGSVSCRLRICGACGFGQTLTETGPLAQPDRPLGQLRLDNANKHQFSKHLLSPELGARQHNGSNALSTLCDSIQSVFLSGVFFNGSANVD
jgi:hypothetical protein